MKIYAFFAIFCFDLLFGVASANVFSVPIEDGKPEVNADRPFVYPFNKKEYVDSDWEMSFPVNGTNFGKTDHAENGHHTGEDWLNPNSENTQNKPIYAINHGLVVFSGAHHAHCHYCPTDDATGYLVIIRHDAEHGDYFTLPSYENDKYGYYREEDCCSTIYSYYLHLSKNDLIEVGSEVSKGDKIGKTYGYEEKAMEGYKYVPHLHFEIYCGQKVKDSVFRDNNGYAPSGSANEGYFGYEILKNGLTDPKAFIETNNSSQTKTFRRIGNLAWYPGDKPCDQACRRYLLQPMPFNLSNFLSPIFLPIPDTINICYRIEQTLMNIAEAENPAQAVPDNYFWQTSYRDFIQKFGSNFSRSDILNHFYIDQKIILPNYGSKGDTASFHSGPGSSPIDATGQGFERKPIDLPEQGLPDFVPNEVRLKTPSGEEKYEYDKSEQIKIHAWFENIGDVDWAGTANEMEVRFYLSKGYKEDSHSEWVRIGKETIKKDGLRLGGTPNHEEEDLDLSQYPEIEPGNYYNIVACADRIADKDNGDGEIPEKHKSNNCSSETVFLVKKDRLKNPPFWMADVNGDSFFDAVRINGGEEKMDVWTSTSRKFNTDAEWYNGPYEYEAYRFRTGDVNGDGRQDTVGIDPVDERFLVWLSNGNGFGAGVEWHNGDYSYPDLHILMDDVNGDDRADVVGVDPDSERFIVWLSNGNGFSSGVEWYNGPYSYSNYMFKVSDANGDGYSDIVGISPEDERFIVWPNLGDGFGAGVEWYNGPYTYGSHFFEAADVNGDGKSDIVAISPSEERFIAWLSNGSSFGGGVEWHNGPFNYREYSFQIADVNGDGRDDIVGMEPVDERFVVWPSLGTQFGTGVEWYNSGGVQWYDGAYSYGSYLFKLGDVNADGNSDVVAMAAGDERFLGWLSDGKSFSHGIEFYDGAFSYPTYTHVPADVNGDGAVDIVAMSPEDERFIVWLSDGDSFGNGVEWYNGAFSYPTYLFHAADVNGDSKADIVAISPENERFLVWINLGNRFSGGIEFYNGALSYPTYVFRMADVNGDGLSDVVGMSPEDERFLVWRSNGSRFLTGAEWYNGAFSYPTYEFRVGDVSGDGKADIVGMDPSDERFILWKSTGSSFAGGVEWYNGPFSYGGYVFELGDVNGDQTDDIIGMDPVEERFVAWLSNGDELGGAIRSLDEEEIIIPVIMKGDLNGDEEVSLADTIISLQVSAGVTSNLPDKADLERGSVSPGGKVGIPDAVFSLQKVSGLR